LSIIISQIVCSWSWLLKILFLSFLVYHSIYHFNFSYFLFYSYSIFFKSLLSYFLILYSSHLTILLSYLSILYPPILPIIIITISSSFILNTHSKPFFIHLLSSTSIIPSSAPVFYCFLLYLYPNLLTYIELMLYFKIAIVFYRVFYKMDIIGLLI
jgi:hypothetical protein